MKTLQCLCTFNDELSWALHPSQRIFCDDSVIPAVFWPDFEDHHRAHPTRVSNVIVSVGVKADVISVPGDMWSGVSCHRTTHVALVALGTVVHFQRDGERGGRLKRAVLRSREAQRKCFWKDKEIHEGCIWKRLCSFQLIYSLSQSASWFICLPAFCMTGYEAHRCAGGGSAHTQCANKEVFSIIVNILLCNTTSTT